VPNPTPSNGRATPPRRSSCRWR